MGTISLRPKHSSKTLEEKGKANKSESVEAVSVHGVREAAGQKKRKFRENEKGGYLVATFQGRVSTETVKNRGDLPRETSWRRNSNTWPHEGIRPFPRIERERESINPVRDALEQIRGHEGQNLSGKSYCITETK